MCESTSAQRFVMPGLDPGIHVFFRASSSWMAGSSPAMTARASYLLRPSIGVIFRLESSMPSIQLTLIATTAVPSGF